MPQDPNAPQDQRDSPRHRVLKGGLIVVNNLSSSFGVTLRDLSDTGVRLKLQDPWDVPARFELFIKDPAAGTSTRRPCEKRWQHGVMVGARFVDIVAPKNREN